MKKICCLPTAEKRMETTEIFLILVHTITETNHSLKTDKYMTAFPTHCTVNQRSE